MNRVQNQLVRFALVAGCLLSIAAAALSYGDWRRHRDELVELLTEAGFENRGEGVIGRVENERTSHHAQIAAARVLVYDVLDAGRSPSETLAVGTVAEEGALEIDSAQWNAAVDRLASAAGLARRALDAQPNNWQAAMLLGAATYLERSVRRDRRLYTAHADWEEPLRLAMREAPGHDEPRRFLAAAYLEVWRALSPEKKRTARALVAEAFENDGKAFSTLVPTWLDVADDLADALALIPDRVEAWRELERVFAERRAWDAFCQVHARSRAAHLRESADRLAEAERRLAFGELFRSRSLLLQVASAAPRDLRFAPLVTRALELYPPGLHGLSSTRGLGEWLGWALELEAFGKNPLPAPVIGRLAGAVGKLEPPRAALAAMVSGEVHYAERLEKMHESLTSEPWGPYLLAKTRWFMGQQRFSEAAETLALTDPVTRRTLAYALARHELARARRDLVGMAQAEKELEAFRARQWSAAGWRWNEHRALLQILPDGPARGFAFELNQVGAGGAVVELRWDGASVALQPVAAKGELEFALRIQPGPHLLELRTIAGEQVFPGEVRLLDNGP